MAVMEAVILSKVARISSSRKNRSKSRWRCDWDIELGFLPNAIEARGHNEFSESGDRTRVTMNGDITIHAAKIPGVPRLLAKKIGGTIEKFVIKMIEPNLRKTNEAVRRYLTDNA